MPIAAKSYAVSKAKAKLAPWDFERRDPKPHDVVIDIKYAGICHSDIHQARAEWGGEVFPMVPGHEITGIVRAVGSSVTKYKVGDKVGVGVFVDSCRTCAHCKRGLEQYCCEGMTGTYNAVERDGVTPTYGGYSNIIVTDENYVLRLPDNLPMDAAAPLLCAGITLYSPLSHWKAGPGKNVGILGLGGLGHMGVKIAHAMGADVSVLSHSAKKEKDALAMGADHFYNTSEDGFFEKMANHFDLIINTVSAEIDYNDYLGLIALDGSMVNVGLPEEPMPVSPFSLLANRRSLAGSMIGGIKETQEMLDFCGKHNIVSDIELIAPDYINEAYDRVVKSDVRYRFVIDISKL
ncbi:MAG TPA: NAD(P)-dependent alcohol dehydrogenase [Alphaproteobacteria bacterium]